MTEWLISIAVLALGLAIAYGLYVWLRRDSTWYRERRCKCGCLYECRCHTNVSRETSS